MKRHLSFLILLIASGTSHAVSHAAMNHSEVTESYWGMHIHHAERGWPLVNFANWRLWDAGVAWPDIEPQKGNWNFSKLDAYMQSAEEHRVRPLLVLALSPGWASKLPYEKSAYANGNASPPKDIENWREYVRKVAIHCKGRIHEYEIWNEPNVPKFYSGSVEELIDLTRAASEIIKSVDPSAIIVSPSATDISGIEWLRRFLNQGGGKYVDVIGYHFYVDAAPPERALPLIEEVQEMIRQYAPGKSLWNTESGWGGRWRGDLVREGPGYVARAYGINWIGGVERFYWYAWDNHDWVRLEMTDRAGKPTEAASAFDSMRRWMLGARFQDCDTDGDGTWICHISRSDRPQMIVWNPLRKVTVLLRTPRTAIDLLGRTRQVSKSIEVGPDPLLLY